MKNSRVTVTAKDVKKYTGDLLVFCIARQEDDSLVGDERVLTMLEATTFHSDFKAKENETLILYPADLVAGKEFQAARLLLVGVGEKNGTVDPLELRERFRAAGGIVSKKCAELQAAELQLGLCPDLGLDNPVAYECFIEGLVLGDYRFLKYKKANDDEPGYGGITKISISAAKKTDVIRKRVRRAEQVAEAACNARDMANEPGNKWTAKEFADYGQMLSKELPLRCKVLDKTQIKRLGMGGIVAVNQGSKEPPRLVILEYSPKKAKKTVMLVGKGLTFDSGGISIKPAAGMQDMKYDMCGGAAVMAAMQVIAKEKPAVQVIGLIPATDNMSGSSALKPGDIIKHYNGVTGEIVNTDAEGRLILADALAYGIEKYEPDCVIDVATLTGAAIIGLGHHHTCILGNDDELVERLIESGKRCSEPLWRLPLGKEYSKQIESQVADIKNAGGRPAGTITAACYLENFVGDTPWAHLDIAGTAWGFTEKSYIPKGPSGIGVRTLFDFVRRL